MSQNGKTTSPLPFIIVAGAIVTAIILGHFIGTENVPSSKIAGSDTAGQTGPDEYAKAQLSLFEGMVRKAPSSAQARIDLGRAYMKAGKVREAVREFREAAKIEPGNKRALAEAGRAYEELGRYDEAMDAYEDALRIDPGDPEANYNLGAVMRKANVLDADEAVAEREAVAEGEEPEGMVAFYAGLGLHQQAIGEINRASGRTSDSTQGSSAPVIRSEEYSPPPTRAPGSGRPSGYSPDIGSRQDTLYGDDSSPYEVFKNLFGGEGSDAGAHTYMGWVDEQQGQYRTAMGEYNQAVKSDPSFVEAWRGLGRIYFLLGRFDESIAAFARVIELAPDDAYAYANMGNAYEYLGNPQKTIENYEKAVALAPADAELWFRIGGFYADLTQWDRALNAFKKAVELDPSNLDGYVELALAYRNTDNPQKEIETLRALVALVPGNPEAHILLGDAYMRGEKPNEAIKCYTEATIRAPDHVGAYIFLGDAYESEGKDEKAAAAYSEAVRIEPGDYEVQVKYGMVLLDLDRYDDAISAFKEALRFNQKYAEAHYGLGFVYVETGELDLAQVEYEALKALDEGLANRLLAKIGDYGSPPAEANGE